MKVYIAGPMFIESQIDYNLMLSRRIRELGIEAYCPNENSSINDKSRRDITGEKIYKHDIDELRSCNILLCQVADCPGTNWEAGYYDCLSKEVNPDKYLGVIGLSTDIRLKTPPDPQKPGIDNQTMYLNQFMVGGLKCSLGLFYTKEDFFERLSVLKAEFDGK